MIFFFVKKELPDVILIALTKKGILTIVSGKSSHFEANKKIPESLHE